MGLSYKMVGEGEVKIIVPKTQSQILKQIEYLEDLLKRKKNHPDKELHKRSLEDLYAALEKF